MMPEEQQALIDTCRHMISRESSSEYSENLREVARIALSALTQPAGTNSAFVHVRRFGEAKQCCWVECEPEDAQAILGKFPPTDPQTARIEPSCNTGRTMPPHEFSQMVNELRDVPAVQSKRAAIVRVLHAFNIKPERPC